MSYMIIRIHLGIGTEPYMLQLKPAKKL